MLLGLGLFATVPTPTETQGRPERRIERIRGRDAVGGEVLVKFRGEPSAATVATYDRLIDGRTRSRVGRGGARLMESDSFDLETLLAFLEKQPDIEYAEPNYLLYANDTTPNDPLFPLLWGLNPLLSPVHIGAVEAWDVTQGSSSIVVGVIDTGIDYTHPDLAGNIWSAPAPFTVTIGGVPIACEAGTHGFNAITDACDPMDDHNHGTHVSGTIAGRGNNGIGVTGVNWVSSLIGGKFLSASGSGSTADAVDVIEFMMQVKAQFGSAANIRVLSNSWGGGGFSQTLLNAITEANTSDMLFVASAGNNARNNDLTPSYPASYPVVNVVSVASITSTGALSSFSNFGALSVDLGAPGSSIHSTTIGGSYATFSGTSMAAPHVSGAAALLLSSCALNTAALRTILLTNVTPLAALTGITATGGHLNVRAALEECASFAAPGAFGKTSPATGTAGVGTGPTLSWTASEGATSYEYCRDTLNNTSCEGVWTSTGTATSVTLNGLAANSTYYWQVRAVNEDATTTADNGTWWSFSTIGAPGAFIKTAPTTGATNVPTSTTFTWNASANATSYEYCRDTLNNSSCDTSWTNVGNVTSLAETGLATDTTYYWQVRALNASGTTNANSGVWSSFRTVSAPGAFNKTSPANGVVNLSSVTLSWAASAGATSYEYCRDTTNDGACDASWTNVGTATSAAQTGLTADTTYYWQVRSVNAIGATQANGGAWWSFRMRALPGAFAKIGPANGATGVALTVTLTWGVSAGATSYEYCRDTTHDSACGATWTSVGTATSVVQSGLAAGTTYSWLVRARNALGTTSANGGVWWSFTTLSLPGAFGKSGPANGATNVPLTTSLSWTASAGTTSYEYCRDTVNNAACDGTWTSVGTARSASLAGLPANTTFYWQVRAKNAAGTTLANGGTWWSFTTVALPGAFNKFSPGNGATNLPTTFTLRWSASAGATSYEYCGDTTNNTVCNSSWVAVGTATSVTVSGVSRNTTYYWQVRARTSGGTTLANGGTWWSLRTQ
jgi:subtilisin family serine protease